MTGRNLAEDAWRENDIDMEASFCGLTVSRDREVITCVITTNSDATHDLFDWLGRFMNELGFYVDYPRVTISGEFPGVDLDKVRYPET